jgi:hypothetical protein
VPTGLSGLGMKTDIVDFKINFFCTICSNTDAEDVLHFRFFLFYVVMGHNRIPDLRIYFASER